MLGETLGWPRIVRATSTARGLSFRVDFCPVATSALASRRELGDKVRLLELRHSAENLPNQNSCRRVVEDALGLSTAISSTPSPCKNPKPVSCTMRSRAKREASSGRRCLRSPHLGETLALSDRIIASNRRVMELLHDRNAARLAPDSDLDVEAGQPRKLREPMKLYSIAEKPAPTYIKVIAHMDAGACLAPVMQALERALKPVITEIERRPPLN
jgi:hypothetical protein